MDLVLIVAGGVASYAVIGAIAARGTWRCDSNVDFWLSAMEEDGMSYLLASLTEEQARSLIKCCVAVAAFLFWLPILLRAHFFGKITVTNSDKDEDK